MAALELKAGGIVSEWSRRCESQEIPADADHTHEVFSIDDLRTLARSAELMAVLAAVQLSIGDVTAHRVTRRLANALQVVVVSMTVAKGLVSGPVR